tara:strand:+ start:276 stop:1400 length:1125 start_codon:yes stop_codon:yes gene_type:complete
MSKSYTPGLKVLKHSKVNKERLLPLKGKVHSDINNKVESDTIVASTEIPGNVQMINMVNKLNIDPTQVLDCMIADVNENVKKDQIIAQNKGLFGMFKTEVKSPIDGKIINISKVTGQVVISEKPLPIEVDAYIPGKINKVYEQEGVIVSSEGTFIQGIIGIGGEKKGIIKLLVDKPDQDLDLSLIDSSLKDSIIVCGSYINYEIYKKAKDFGVKGIICGGVDYNTISDILGYSLGVAITGMEDTTTLIITEGFGSINMALKTFNLLKDNDGKRASINGATQIRAGVLRPEIFIKLEDNINSKDFSEDDLIISEGSTVRIIREPYFGKIGKIISLPFELMMMKSETKVRVAEVEFDDKSKAIIPRANLEVILSNE